MSGDAYRSLSSWRICHLSSVLATVLRKNTAGAGADGTEGFARGSAWFTVPHSVFLAVITLRSRGSQHGFRFASYQYPDDIKVPLTGIDFCRALCWHSAAQDLVNTALSLPRPTFSTSIELTVIDIVQSQRPLHQSNSGATQISHSLRLQLDNSGRIAFLINRSRSETPSPHLSITASHQVLWSHHLPLLHQSSAQHSKGPTSDCDVHHQ